MSENLATAIFLAALLAVGALYIAFKAYGWKVAALTIAAPFWLGWKTLRFSAFLGSRAVIGARRKRVKDPESAELVEREVINPPRIPKIQTLDHGSHNTPAGLIKAVHKVTLAESGAAKGQTGINYDIQFALQYSPENLMILEVKPDKDLSNVVYAYARPQDRIWEYTLQPGDEYSSSLNLASDLTQLKDMARMISHEKNSKDPHWNDKCANLIPSAGIALSDQDIYASTGQLTATLNYIRDAVTDRRWLDELRDHHPVVENVADAENEWSYIRSTATKHLDALSEMRLRRVFAGGPDTPQPTFRGYPGGGRHSDCPAPRGQRAPGGPLHHRRARLPDPAGD